MIFILLNSNEPIYIQIIKHFKIEIIKGNLKVGDTIPSRREFAVSVNVNPNTVQKAYKEMEAMGIIKTVKNQQSKITDDVEILNLIREEFIKESLGSFLREMKSIDVKKEEIIKIINENY